MIKDFSNVEAEQTLLGMILVNNKHFWAAAHLAATDFSQPQHQKIFVEVKRVLESGGITSPITLKPAFDNDPDFAQIGGARYLMQLAKMAIQIEDPAELAGGILKAAQAKKIWNELTLALDQLSAPDLNPAEFVTSICNKLDLAVTEIQNQDAESDKAIIGQLLEDCLNPLACFPTGIDVLDDAMGGGIMEGCVYGFTAPDKSGKTAMLVTLAENFNLYGTKVLYLALEMGRKQIMQRVASRRMAYNPKVFLSKARSSEAFQTKLLESKEIGGNLYITDKPAITFDELKSYLMRSVRRLSPKIVILDYFQLVAPNSEKQDATKHLDNVAQWIAGFAKRYNVAVIVAAQQNEEGKVRGGGGLKNACDQLYAINSCEMATSDGVELQTWLGQSNSRYTERCNVGSKTDLVLRLNPKGVFFEQIGS